MLLFLSGVFSAQSRGSLTYHGGGDATGSLSPSISGRVASPPLFLYRLPPASPGSSRAPVTAVHSAEGRLCLCRPAPLPATTLRAESAQPPPPPPLNPVSQAFQAHRCESLDLWPLRCHGWWLREKAVYLSLPFPLLSRASYTQDPELESHALL